MPPVIGRGYARPSRNDSGRTHFCLPRRGEVGDSYDVPTPRPLPEPIPKLLKELRRRFKPHAVILYGSRSRGAGTAASDWDLFLLRKGSRERHVRDFDGHALDVFVENDAIAKLPITTDLLRLRGGKILLDERGVARRLLRRVNALAKRGPPKPMKGEVQALKVWAWKMVDRAKSGGSYGNYRRVALLTELLSLSYELQGRFFPGPKRALAEQSTSLKARWAAALLPGASIHDIEDLVTAVVGAR
jgi:predicted nucleotidyltransferase